jgi:hypothetical protein
VGTAARILVSSVILKLSSKGTFRSTLTNTLFPFKSVSFKLLTLFLVAIFSINPALNPKQRKNPDQETQKRTLANTKVIEL